MDDDEARKAAEQSADEIKRQEATDVKPRGNVHSDESDEPALPTPPPGPH